MIGSLSRNFLMVLLFLPLGIFAQDRIIGLTLNGEIDDLAVISDGVYCLDNNDTLSFQYLGSMEGKEYVFQGIFIYAQINLANPQRIFSIPQISAPLSIALRDLVPEDKIPPYKDGGTRISIVVSRVLQVKGNRVEEIINIPAEEQISLVVVSGCKD